jgi:hypothetical protein
MNKLLPIASLALIVGGLNAQSTSMNVPGDILVSANKVTDTLAKGVVTSSAYARARDGKSWWRPAASASKSVRHYTSKYSGRSSASVSDSASAAMGTNTASVAKGSVDVVIKAAKKGSLVLSYYGRGAANLNVSGGATWAPKADGKRQTLTVEIKAAGDIKFNVASDAAATATTKAGDYASNSFSATFIPEFVMTTCSVNNKGNLAGCNSISLTAGTPTKSGTRHVVPLTVAGPNSAWYLNLMAGADKGTAMANKCLLLDKPMWAGFGRTDAKGASTSSLRINGGKAMTAAMQSAFFTFNKGFTLETSNSIVITCK